MLSQMTHVAISELEAALPYLRRSPREAGSVELIVRRPAAEGREVLEEAELPAKCLRLELTESDLAPHVGAAVVVHVRARGRRQGWVRLCR